jgi:imidazolonepropionase
MLEKNIRVAIGTDYNPGSCVYNSQPLMMNFAMMFGKMKLEDAFKGVTRNAALSLNRKKIGIIEEGAQADLILWKLDDIAQIPYYNTESAQFITHVIKKGRVFNRLPKVKATREPKEKKEEKK